MLKEIYRKLFHLVALVYVGGLYVFDRRSYLMLLGALVLIEGALELTRFFHAAFRDWTDRLFGMIIRPRERTAFSGIFWMLLGVWSAVFVLPNQPLAAAAILYLVLGDAVAGIAGTYWRGPAWGRSNKRVSGSAACFAVCLAVGAVLIAPSAGWPAVFVGAAVATVVELGVIPGDDNITIPLASALALRFCAGSPSPL